MIRRKTFLCHPVTMINRFNSVTRCSAFTSSLSHTPQTNRHLQPRNSSQNIPSRNPLPHSNSFIRHEQHKQFRIAQIHRRTLTIHGTITIAQGNIVSRIVNSGTDALGRYCYIELAGKQNCNVVIITAYQGCHQSYITNQTIKSLTAAAQQYSILQQHDRINTPRKAFIHDISAFVKTIHARNHGVLLMGDFN
jgi:hypothetical protein